MKLVAHALVQDPYRIIPAQRRRPEPDINANPNRCRPMTLANQAGWWVLNSAPFWAYGTPAGEVKVEYERGWKVPEFPAKAHFGANILTIDLPFLWLTEPGWDLHVRGPANHFYDGAYPIEAILESSWAQIPIPMNWQLRPESKVHFNVDDPIAQVTPIRTRDLLEFDPELVFDREAVQIAGQYYESRKDEYERPEPTIKLTGYYRGERPDGQKFDNLRRLDLKEFKLG